MKRLISFTEGFIVKNRISGGHAFTLAEVLITLGIIGVVASMTLPAVVSRYKKIETVTKLKAAKTTLDTAFRLAVAEYGDMKGWDYVDSFEVPAARKSFIDKYLIPYVKNAKPSEKDAYDASQMGYSSKYYPHQPNGSLVGMSSVNYYPIALLNGIFFYAGHDGYGNLVFHVDLNGVNKPNLYGYDLFQFALVPEKNSVKMATYQYLYLTNDGYVYCRNTNALGCGVVIEKNGWDIPEDYPIKF